MNSIVPAAELRLLEQALLQPLLEPLQAAFGDDGEVAVQAFSQALAERLTQ